MNNLQEFGLTELSIEEKQITEGGDMCDSAYALGHAFGEWIGGLL